MTINGYIKIKALANFWIFEVKPPLTQALELVPDDKLDWSPKPEMIKLGHIFYHIAECSAWWIGTLIDKETPPPDVPSNGLTKRMLSEMMEKHWQTLERFFSRCPEILENTYEYTDQGKIHKYDGQWIMFHIFEHDIHHRSQINQYLRILGITPPQI
ncbi:MAG: hypothetical protein GX409_05205 [candidate division Zixibacteria bacterium]|jgi:uncharacterized damage-inducible protein DinB|nr:hypothetical protein [candidate division Zixibacteria bacterium]